MHSGDDIYPLNCYINEVIDKWLKEPSGGRDIYVSRKTREKLVSKLVYVLTDEPYGKGSTRYKKDEKKEQVRKYYKALKAV